MDSADRARRLADLADQQTRQREQQVADLAELHQQITRLRDELKTAEQTYRAAYRRIITAGLLTGPQLRTLGLPPLDARRRPRPTPAAGAQHSIPATPNEPGEQRPPDQ